MSLLDQIRLAQIKAAEDVVLKSLETMGLVTPGNPKPLVATPSVVAAAATADAETSTDHRSITVLHPWRPDAAVLREHKLHGTVYGTDTVHLEGEATPTTGCVCIFSGSIDNLRTYLSPLGSCIVSEAPVANTWKRMWFTSPQVQPTTDTADANG